MSVPSGVHSIEFVYRPASFVAGALGSLLGVAGVVLLCFTKLAKGRLRSRGAAHRAAY